MIRDYAINIAIGSGIVAAIVLIAGFIDLFPWTGWLVQMGTLLLLVIVVCVIGGIARDFLELFWS